MDAFPIGQGVVEVMEVTLLFVEVKSFQRSKSVRVVPHSLFFSHWIKEGKVLSALCSTHLPFSSASPSHLMKGSRKNVFESPTHSLGRIFFLFLMPSQIKLNPKYFCLRNRNYKSLIERQGDHLVKLPKFGFFSYFCSFWVKGHWTVSSGHSFKPT